MKSEVQRLLGKQEVFDPRVIDDKGSKQLWTSESVELAIQGLSEGYKLKDNPFLATVKDARLRKANLAYDYTEDELDLIAECADDKVFFGNNFTKLKDGNNGWVNIKLRSYQENVLHQYTNNRWNILLFPRQSGKTTTTIIEIVHFLTFNFEKDAVVIAQSEKVVNEILSKIKECFNSLPFFMQPGFVSFTKKGCVLDNGCRLSIGVASESVVQGFSLDLLFIDEFAYIRDAETFWNNVYPTLTNNPNSRCIIASTPNGRNLFYKLWVGAINKTNTFTSYRLYWYDVPGRDEQFKKDTIANVGLNGWLMGYECSFDVGLKSIFPTTVQKRLRELQTENLHNWSVENDFLGLLEHFDCVDKSIIDYNWKIDYFLMSIDISEGLEQDSTVLKIKKIRWSVEKKRLEYVTVAVFKDNTISVEDFALKVLDILKYFDNNKIRVVVENNTYGGEFFASIQNFIFAEPERYKYFDKEVFAKFIRDSKNNYEYGIRWNHFNKKTAVKSFSKYVSDGTFVESYNDTIEEYLNFGRQKNDSFAASYGHDDLTMADVTAAAYVRSNDLFARQYFSEVERVLRINALDEPEEIVKARERKLLEEKRRFKWRDWSIRTPKEKVSIFDQKEATFLI